MTTLKVGDKAPNFKAIDQDENTISLADFKGKKLVLFFYPKASTPGCTMEACNLSDNYNRFIAQGYAILGVSADSAKRQSNFKEKYNTLKEKHVNLLKFYDFDYNLTEAETEWFKCIEDIKNLKLIYYLVKERGLTLDGAKKKIKDQHKALLEKSEMIESLNHVKDMLLELKDSL